MRPSAPITAAAAATLLGLAAAPALAQQSVTVDLANVQIRNATNQSRTSNPATLAPAARYSYVISGSVRGQPFLSPLYFLYPNPVPLATVLDSFTPGSSSLLSGVVANPGGLHPFAVSNIMFDVTTEISGVTVNFAATISAGIDGSNFAFFTIQDVIISPSSIGYLQFTTGSAVITRIPCPANFSDGGLPGDVNSNDISAFLTAWLADTNGGTTVADYNLDGLTNSNDISAYLTEWLATVATGCPL
jgi:hypothetical protein